MLLGVLIAFCKNPETIIYAPNSVSGVILHSQPIAFISNTPTAYTLHKMSNREVIISSLQRLGASDAEIAQLSHIAARESGFNPSARNPKSSASGQYQFLESTWEYLKCGDNIYNIDQQNACALKELRAGRAAQQWFNHW